MMTEPAPTPLALAALASLAERPMHPYEMYQLALARRDHRLVKIRPGTLYHAVARLEADGLVEVRGTEREGNRPERTTYAITTAGRSLLQRRIAQLLAEEQDEYPAFPFALSEAHNLPPTEVVALLERRLAAVRDTIAEIEAGIVLVRHKHLPWRYWLHLDYLRAQHAATAVWLGSALADIAAGRFDHQAEHHHPDQHIEPLNSKDDISV